MNCPDCPGEIIPGSFSPIRVPAIDADGFPILAPETGFVKMVTLKLPNHRVRLVGQSTDTREDPPRWTAFPERRLPVWDPTALVPVLCDHGITEHPLGFSLGMARSFVRAKYATTNFKCVVDAGQPVPDDLTTPRVAP